VLAGAEEAFFVTRTLRIFLSHLIDYAGLFPPAALEMPEAKRNYVAYRAGEYSWMLARFVVPAARLDEVDPAWPMSVIGAPPRHVEVCEMKAQAALPDADVTYFEIPIDDDPARFAALGARAKIRLGGAVVPSCREVAGFLHARVPFKATAGLHHPIRSGAAHGFVNLFLAAALAWRGGDPAATLEEESAAAFHFADDAVRWHGHAVTAEQLQDAREQFAISFGSCSFEEPIDDLKALGWL
jgi:hypothetical protein